MFPNQGYLRANGLHIADHPGEDPPQSQPFSGDFSEGQIHQRRTLIALCAHFVA